MRLVRDDIADRVADLLDRNLRAAEKLQSVFDGRERGTDGLESS
jgi:hypothetical protein